jgi:hypothetical protein
MCRPRNWSGGRQQLVVIEGVMSTYTPSLVSRNIESGTALRMALFLASVSRRRARWVASTTIMTA